MASSVAEKMTATLRAEVTEEAVRHHPVWLAVAFAWLLLQGFFLVVALRSSYVWSCRKKFGTEVFVVKPKSFWSSCCGGEDGWKTSAAWHEALSGDVDWWTRKGMRHAFAKLLNRLLHLWSIGATYLAYRYVIDTAMGRGASELRPWCVQAAAIAPLIVTWTMIFETRNELCKTTAVARNKFRDDGVKWLMSSVIAVSLAVGAHHLVQFLILHIIRGVDGLESGPIVYEVLTFILMAVLLSIVSAVLDQADQAPISVFGYIYVSGVSVSCGRQGRPLRLESDCGCCDCYGLESSETLDLRCGPAGRGSAHSSALSHSPSRLRVYC